VTVLQLAWVQDLCQRCDPDGSRDGLIRSITFIRDALALTARRSSSSNSAASPVLLQKPPLTVLWRGLSHVSVFSPTDKLPCSSCAAPRCPQAVLQSFRTFCPFPAF